MPTVCWNPKNATWTRQQYLNRKVALGQGDSSTTGGTQISRLPQLSAKQHGIPVGGLGNSHCRSNWHSHLLHGRQTYLHLSKSASKVALIACINKPDALQKQWGLEARHFHSKQLNLTWSTVQVQRSCDGQKACRKPNGKRVEHELLPVLGGL